MGSYVGIDRPSGKKVLPDLGEIWRGGGQRWLDDLQLADAFVDRIESLRDLIELYDREIRQCDARIHPRLRGHPGYQAVQALRGVGPVLAAVFVAEIGDVTRFDNPRRLCSWPGLIPRLRESDTHSHRGHITKQGSRLLRWAAVEAVSGAVRDPQIASINNRVGAAAGVATSDASPPRVTSSRLSSTACATARPVASAPTQRDVGHGHDAARERHDPRCGRLT